MTGIYLLESYEPVLDPGVAFGGWRDGNVEGRMRFGTGQCTTGALQRSKQRHDNWSKALRVTGWKLGIMEAGGMVWEGSLGCVVFHVRNGLTDDF